MQSSSPIIEYGDALARELSFDLPLARRVRQEIEDHLWEAATEGSGGGSLDAQREAIRRFGDPKTLASQYAVASLLQQARQSGAIVILGVAGIFVAMVMRIAWYTLLHWTIRADLRGVGGIALAVDKYAFVLALAVGAIGWAYIVSRPIPHEFSETYRRQLRLSIGLCIAAAVPLIACVLSDLVLMGLRAAGPEAGWVLIPPALMMVLEIACAAAFVMHLRGLGRRSAIAKALLQG